MKTILFSIFVLLAILVIGGGILVFGPFRDLLPSGTRNVVDNTIPDYFSVNSRPTAIPGGNNDLPLGGSATSTTTLQTTWTLESVVPSRTVVVRQFVQSTTTSTTSASLPAQDVYLVPQTSDVPYTILYFAHDQSFMVSLLKEPLGDSRRSAEQKLLFILGISEGDACFLRYAVTVPSFVNSFYAGKNLGFSFCPGASPL